MENSQRVFVDAHGVKIGDKYETLLCGSLFSFRIPRAHWAERIEKLKRAGYNCVDVYLPWNYHERADGSFDFTGERDVKEFFRLLSEAGIYIVVRPGPYICSEWTGGAIPARILESGMPLRCTDERFMAEVRNWYRAAFEQIKPFEYGKGGNVIFVQLDNELDFFNCPDPDGYIAALRDIALECGITVPFVACAGQYGIQKAGGMVEGVQKTLNCYPDSADTTFDKELRSYALLLQKEGTSLFVTETNRDHFILRRELSCGSKLLGAYNQVAGTNFDFNESVNNWGSPLSFLAAEYDFWSLIDAAGNYEGSYEGECTDEARESYIFSKVLTALGERIAGALSSEETVVPTACEFPYAEGGMSVLELLGGGKAVCAANFGKSEGKVTLTVNGKEISGVVPSYRAPFFLFDVDLKESGVSAMLTRTNCEPIAIGEGRIAFLANKEPLVGLDFGNGEVVIKKSAVVNGVKVEILKEKDVVPADLKRYKYKTGGKAEIYASETLPTPKSYPAQTQVNLGALGISCGMANYKVSIPAGKKLFAEAPCDMLSYETDGKVSATLVADGRHTFLPASESGEYLVKAQKWGHSNFDDPQAPSIRLSCKKGVTSFGFVESEVQLARGNFKLLSSFGDKKIDLSEPYPVRLDVTKWNTTIKPCICAYTFPVTRTTDRLLLGVSEDAEIAVYLDGKLLGTCDFGSFELTQFTGKDKEYRLTLVYRKRVWTQNVGSAKLYGINTVKAEAEVLSKQEFASFHAEKGKKLTLPLRLDMGKPVSVAIDVSKVEKECFLVAEGKNVLLTCVLGGRVISRNLLDWENAPLISGGNPKKIYLSPVWCQRDKILSVYIEPLGEGAAFTSAAYLS